MEIFEIIRLLQKEKTGSLTPAEEELLQEWKGRPGAREVLDRLSSDAYGEQFLRELHGYDAEAAWKAFCRPRRRLFPRVLWWAAAVVPVVFSLFLLYGRYGTSPEPLPDAAYLSSAGMETAGAVLVLPGDRKVLLGQGGDRLLKEDSCVVVRSDSSTLSYSQKGAVSGIPVFNELHVPPRGEYSLRLGDGTRIYLNACSRLRYPENFGPSAREVELEGEAYFEVARDSARPFRVRVAGMGIEVLGTTFNVNAYPAAGPVRTTLVSGKVRLDCRDGRLELRPGEQGIVDGRSGRMERKKVDVGLYTAWKDGLFKFERERLEDILLVLKRWYDVEIRYRDDRLKDGLFSGDLRRYDRIGSHLEMLEMTTDLSLEMKGDTVYVGYRDKNAKKN